MATKKTPKCPPPHEDGFEEESKSSSSPQPSYPQQKAPTPETIKNTIQTIFGAGPTPTDAEISALPVLKLDPNTPMKQGNVEKIYFSQSKNVPFTYLDVGKFPQGDGFHGQDIIDRIKTKCHYYCDKALSMMMQLEKTKTHCNGIQENQSKDTKEHENLYVLIEKEMQEIEKRKHKKAEQDMELKKEGINTMDGIAECAKDYQRLVDKNLKSKSDAEKEEGNATGEALKKVIGIYSQLDADFNGFKGKDQKALQESVNQYMEHVKKGKINYKDKHVQSQIQTMIQKIHGEGVSSHIKQSAANFVFNISPFSSLLVMFDLGTECTRKKELYKENGEPFRVPYGCATIQVGNRIILTGGSKDLLNHLNDTFEYSLLRELLIKRNDLITPRSEHTMVAAKNIVYVIGGRDGTGHLNACEKCNLTVSASECVSLKDKSKPMNELYKWMPFAELNKKKSYVSVCKFSSALQKRCLLYAFGGLQEDTLLNDIEFVDTEKPGEKWNIYGIMAGFAGHSMGVIKLKKADKEGILILGGMKENNVKSQDAYFMEINQNVGNDKTERPMLALADLKLGREEEFHNRMPMKMKKGEIYVLGQFQAWKLSVDKELMKWEAVEKDWTF